MSMKKYIRAILIHPVTHFNILSIGLLIMIQTFHNYAHYKMEHDIHGVVRKYCREKPYECAKYLPENLLK